LRSRYSHLLPNKELLMKVRYILWVKPYIDAGQPCAVWKETLIVERFMIGL